MIIHFYLYPRAFIQLLCFLLIAIYPSSTTVFIWCSWSGDHGDLPRPETDIHLLVGASYHSLSDALIALPMRCSYTTFLLVSLPVRSSALLANRLHRGNKIDASNENGMATASPIKLQYKHLSPVTLTMVVSHEVSSASRAQFHQTKSQISSHVEADVFFSLYHSSWQLRPLFTGSNKTTDPPNNTLYISFVFQYIWVILGFFSISRSLGSFLTSILTYHHSQTIPIRLFRHHLLLDEARRP